MSAPSTTSPLRPSSLEGLGTVAAFLLASLPLGTFWFVALAAPILLGASLATAWAVVVGLILGPVWWSGGQPRKMFLRGLALILAPLAWLSARGATAERRRMRNSLGLAVASPYRRLPGPPPAWDPAVWRDLGYLLVLPPLGAAELAAVVGALALPLAAVALPAWLFVAFPDGVPLGRGLRIDTTPEAIVVAVVALPVCVLAGYLLISGFSRAHAAWGRALLGPSSARLAERVEELTESRSRVLAAELAERRRIERDLHDGAQQRLVSLAMDLGLAREKLARNPDRNPDTDPDAARKLVEGAHGEAKRALSEIRDLVRGIHPAVLADRGLDPAIRALADRCPVRVEVEVRLDTRPPEAVETTAYFVVAEALANVAKHAQATRARVAVHRETPGLLVVEIEDDGKGSATTQAGTGLAGLRDRLAALDGTLRVESPAGGPTRVRAELPLSAPGEARRSLP